MGSFNTTCLVSQQTIVPYAQCVIIPIQQQSTFNPVSLTGLDLFNIRLSPMVYAGQDYDNSEGKSFAKMIKSVSSSINKEIKAQYS